MQLRAFNVGNKRFFLSASRSTDTDTVRLVLTDGGRSWAGNIEPAQLNVPKKGFTVEGFALRLMQGLHGAPETVSDSLKVAHV